jgi:hypothetical protein
LATVRHYVYIFTLVNHSQTANIYTGYVEFPAPYNSYRLNSIQRWSDESTEVFCQADSVGRSGYREYPAAP